MQEILSAILAETTKLDFPMFSNQEKRETIMMNTKTEFEEKIYDVLKELDSDYRIKTDELWSQAIEHANKEFESLHGTKLNGFYFQEVMHKYIELIIEDIERR